MKSMTALMGILAVLRYPDPSAWFLLGIAMLIGLLSISLAVQRVADPGLRPVTQVLLGWLARRPPH